MSQQVCFPQFSNSEAGMDDPRQSVYFTPPSSPLEDPTLTEEDILIVLLGPTGSGKSTFINRLIGRDGAFVGEGLCSCTKGIHLVQCSLLPGQSNRIFLVDTPGFDDGGTTDLKILEMLATWFTETFKQKIKVSGVLFFHRITDNRYTSTSAHNLELLQGLCGLPSLKNVFIVTSMWDELQTNYHDEAVEREKRLQEYYWSSLIHRGSRVFRHNGTQFSAQTIINHIRPVKLDLKIQLEMVNQKKPLPQTTAGKTVHTRLHKMVEDIKKFIASCHESDHDRREKLTAQLNVIRSQLNAFHPTSLLHFPSLRRLRASSLPNQGADFPLPTTSLIFKEGFMPGQSDSHDRLQKTISLLRWVNKSKDDSPKAFIKVCLAALRICKTLEHEVPVDRTTLTLLERIGKFARSAVVRDNRAHAHRKIQENYQSLLSYLQQIQGLVEEPRHSLESAQTPLIDECNVCLANLSKLLRITAPSTALLPQKSTVFHTRLDQRFDRIEMQLNIRMTELQTCRCSGSESCR
ncbi:P-loop containing nucleoside triphosphate hydrolase protein [Panaeolus papilionaceus]|nr:P-loop containing nucleoside triphosphate hydrolase protein [Panaeolus papilionaceus]